MELLLKLVHPTVHSTEGRGLRRDAVRAVIMHGDDILLLYTRRYDDYSLPGGGLDEGEDMLDGLRRELAEETGAQEVRVAEAIGYIDEYRPSPKPGYDHLFMRSHIYRCEASRALGPAQMEHYEISNGMAPEWVNLEQAAVHNEAVIARQDEGMGMSIIRETWTLNYLRQLRGR
jgi:ADP-ribose pyrophosphatase YjhB (NUDIX family)